MITKFFKCTLKTDIVINASLATEGNMKTLDHIPGSNFLGVVANAYGKFKAENKALDVFHSGKVSFGDAHISVNDSYSYAVPFSLMVNKLNREITGKKAEVWVHHFLEKNKKDEALDSIQFKQHRGGFFNTSQQYIPKVEKRFALKSAQNRLTRKSKDEAMFGFDSIKKGQVFVFYVNFADDTYIDEVIKELTGDKRIGKSKSAQYGQVCIESLPYIPTVYESNPCTDQQLIIYVESNLCLFNDYGQATFLPTAKHFGLEGQGDINWAASQIRTHTYAPWNTYRGTSDQQRNCILKGSVIVFEFNKEIKPKIPSKSIIGAYCAEGLGRVIYNPGFLNTDPLTSKWSTILEKYQPAKKLPIASEVKSPIGFFLQKKQAAIQQELHIGQAVQDFLDKQDKKNNSYKSMLSSVSTSQWGGIRNLAVNATSWDELRENLFGNSEDDKKDNRGFLMNGVAAEKIWDKQKGKLRRLLLMELLKAKGQKLLPKYFAKLAAEMTKLKQLEKSQAQN